MASDSPENPQYQLILQQSDLSELSPQMQKLLLKIKKHGQVSLLNIKAIIKMI